MSSSIENMLGLPLDQTILDRLNTSIASRVYTTACFETMLEIYQKAEREGNTSKMLMAYRYLCVIASTTMSYDVSV
jgi:hypothetical protein